MSKKIFNPSSYEIIQDKYTLEKIYKILHPKYSHIGRSWIEYIKILDIGISCDYYKDSYVYLITDKKKWMLAKIKYGI